MKKIYKFIYILLILIVFIVTYCCFKRANKNTVLDNDIHFLKTYGSTNYIDGQKNSLTLGFIAPSSLKFKKEVLTLTLGNSNITSSNLIIKKSFSYQKYTLWYLQFDITIDTAKCSLPDLVLEHISLNTFQNKPLGKLVIHIAGNSNNLFSSLKLQSCAGASMGLGLSDYHAEFKNTGKDSLVIDSIAIPEFNQAMPILYVNDIAYQDYTKVKINPNESVKLTIFLSECVNDFTDVYYVSPIVNYHNTVTKQNTQISLDYYTSGLNITKEQLAYILKRL